jgi:signal peptidase II
MNADSLQQPQIKVPMLLFVLVAVLVVLDQYSKYLCTLYLEMGLPVAVFPGLDLLLAHNKGAAFSFLDDAGGWQRWLFAGISVVVSMVLTLWLWRLPRQQQLLGFALACILGGALGNLIDRVMLGYVVDFISVYYAQWRFATFNVADAAISCGAALLVLDVVLHGAQHE